jgi:catechol 2,3-dioxygenase-like lactoylglutathione lyase family enzyme
MMKLASTRIVTKDVPALARFYETLTQIAPVSPIGDPSVFVEFRNSGSLLAIGDERGVVRFNAGAAVGAANRSMIIEFEVLDVNADRARLDQVVTNWVMEPTDMPWGNRSMLLRDPDGNLINIYAPIKKTSK